MSGTSLEKINFSFIRGYQLEIASWGHVLTSFAPGPHLWTGANLCMLPRSPWVCLYVSSAVFRRPVSLMTSGCYTLPSSSSSVFPGPWREEFSRDIPFRAECFEVSYSLHNVLLWISVFVPSPKGGSFRDDHLEILMGGGLWTQISTNTVCFRGFKCLFALINSSIYDRLPQILLRVCVLEYSEL